MNDPDLPRTRAFGAVTRPGVAAARAALTRAGRLSLPLRRSLEPVRYPLEVAIGSRVAVYLLVAMIGWTLRRPKGSGLSYHAFFAPLSLWDAKWYGWIASYGYDPLLGHGNTVAFFPLFPLIWRALSALPLPATLTVSLFNSACFVAAVAIIHVLTRSHFGERVANTATLLICFFPTSFIYSMPYSEGVFLLLTALAFLALEHGRLGRAVGCSSLAIVARPVGIFLIPAIIISEGRRSGFRSRRVLLSSGTLVAVYGCVLGYLAWSTGDLLANTHAEYRGWGRHLVIPLILTWHALSGGTGQTHHLRSALDLAFIALWIAMLVVLVRRRVPREYVVYSGLTVIAPVADGSIISMGRLGMVAFPLFWGLAALTRTSDKRVLAAAIVSALLLPAVIYLSLGSQSYVP